jgi:hypothetical protein
MGKSCVFSEGWTHFLNIIYTSFSLKGLKYFGNKTVTTGSVAEEITERIKN